MTRVLSELLGAKEPTFRLGLMQLEQGSGRPNADIRLTTEIMHGTQAKLKELGLDPHDTEGHELYAALRTRLHADEASLAKALKGTSTKSDDPLAYIPVALQKEITQKTCFALKNAVSKRLIKANIPKKTMKLLGYRSIDSMLKHESVVCLFAAASLVESDTWIKKLHTSYNKLKTTDFESRELTIEYPTAKRWQMFAESTVGTHKRNIVSFKELGAVVILPLPVRRPELATLTAAVLTLQAANEVIAAGTFLRLHQMQSQFGTYVRQVVIEEPALHVQLLDRSVSWNMVQRYCARFRESLSSDLFEPVMRVEDVAWHSIEHVLARIAPTLAFWQDTGHLAHLHNGQTVSCNLVDQVLSHCNKLPYDQRVVQHFKNTVMTELALRYMTTSKVEQVIASRFQGQLAADVVSA